MPVCDTLMGDGRAENGQNSVHQFRHLDEEKWELNEEKQGETMVDIEREAAVDKCFRPTFSYMLSWSSPIVSILFMTGFITEISQKHKDRTSLENDYLKD